MEKCEACAVPCETCITPPVALDYDTDVLSDEAVLEKLRAKNEKQYDFLVKMMESEEVVYARSGVSANSARQRLKATDHKLITGKEFLIFGIFNL